MSLMMPVLRRIPMVVLTIVLGVRGPGLVTTDEQKSKLVPLMSISSTSTLSEKAGHSVWKCLIPPSGISEVVLSPGSIIAGAGGVKGSVRKNGWIVISWGQELVLKRHSIMFPSSLNLSLLS